MYINTLTLEYDLALRGLAQMALVTYIMLRSLITDTLVISSRKSPFHSELHFEKKAKRGKKGGKGKQAWRSTVTTEFIIHTKKYPKPQSRANLIQEE